MLPGCGDAIDAREAYTGQDIRTGETLPLWRRGLTRAAMFLPLIGGATVRTVVDGGGDFLKNAAKNADELIDGAGESIASQLTRAQTRNTNTLKNIVENNLTDGDFSGALEDLQGNPIPKPGGGYWDHLTEMKQSYTALKNIKNGLEGTLQNPNLIPEVRTFLQDRLQMANTYIQKIQDLFEAFGGIE